MDLLTEYRWRGMLQDATEGADGAFSWEPRTAYIGFDPTAPSLHVGSLLPIMGLVHLQRAGHTPIALVGGGTGLIGDPSGKTEERKLLSKEEAEENTERIRTQLEHFLDFEARENPAVMENNLSWLASMPLIDFLRDTGKHFSVNNLLGKESIRRRVETDEEGITFTEFSYVLLQAYDFLALYDRHHCTVQLGGSDQWGNITAGIDLIRRVRSERTYGVVFPLVTGAGGLKFGKTESGTVWLDAELTSPYRFYQFWMNTDDAEVVRYLKFFSLKPLPEIKELEAAVAEEPQKREAQTALADELTLRLHGQAGLDRARQATKVLFGGNMIGLDAEVIGDIFADVPSSDVPRSDFEGEGKDLLDLLVEVRLATSRGDARRSIMGGGIYVNNLRVGDPESRVAIQHAIEGRYLVLRKGKKRYHLVRVAS